MNPMIRTAEMCITGKYGMVISHFQNIVNISSDMHLSFGFQSFPSVKNAETVTDDPKELNPFSYVMEKHQRNYGGNGKIAKYMQAAYRYPENFSDFVYASQLLQADGIRYGVEHYRRNRGRCMGAIYWQLNDCWPVISWSSIDYYGRWKALHYYAKRFFAPVMLSCEEQSWMTVEADMNRQHFEFEKSIRLNVTNETTGCSQGPGEMGSAKDRCHNSEGGRTVAGSTGIVCCMDG